MKIKVSFYRTLCEVKCNRSKNKLKQIGDFFIFSENNDSTNFFFYINLWIGHFAVVPALKGKLTMENRLFHSSILLYESV